MEIFNPCFEILANKKSENKKGANKNFTYNLFCHEGVAGGQYSDLKFENKEYL